MNPTGNYLVSKPTQLPALMRELERRLERGKALRVRIDPSPSRSTEQNAYLHVAIRALADHTGHNETELREFLKAEHGPQHLVTVAGVSRMLPKSVGAYTVSEASDMITHVELYASQVGLLLAPESHAGAAW